MCRLCRVYLYIVYIIFIKYHFKVLTCYSKENKIKIYSIKESCKFVSYTSHSRTLMSHSEVFFVKGERVYER